MDPVVVISGGGIIGNYISSRLKLNSIQSIVVEKELRNIEYKHNIRTLTLNSFSKKLLDELDIKINVIFSGSDKGNLNHILNTDHIFLYLLKYIFQ